MTTNRVIRIGNGAGFWGDQVDAPKRLAESGVLDYLTLEYLAELTLSILAYQKSKDPKAGFVSDFPTTVRELVPSFQAQPNLKLVTNAGGMNPRQCAIAVSKVCAENGLENVRVACVEGDNLLDRIADLRANGHRFDNLDTGESIDSVLHRLVSANVYLGCQGIVDCLNEGAQIVITGRIADAALCVGPAVHEFNWQLDDWDRIGQATVAGHLIECGAQVTGGIESTWSPKVPLANVGYPIAEIDSQSNVVITKPKNTDGRVTIASVAEQLVYEIGDPAHYLTPDIDADFRHVKLDQIGTDRVQVTGGTGTSRPETLKVSMAYQDGFMSSNTIVLTGPNAVEKARHAGKMIEDRLALAGIQLAHFESEVIGSGDIVGGVVADAHTQDPWDVVLRVCARDPSRDALIRMGREIAPLVTSGPPGVTGYTGARSRPHPVMAFWPTTIARDQCQHTYVVASATDWISEEQES